MGIKGLKQFLKSKFSECLEPSHLYFYWGKKAAMDLLPYLYRYKVSHGENWKEGLFTLFTTCIRHNVHLSVIMDGPEVYKEKDKEREKRKSSRDKIKMKIEQLERDLSEYEKNGTITELLKSVSDESSHRNLLLSVQVAISKKTVIDTILKLKNQLVTITPEDIESIKDLCGQLSLPFYFARQEAESFSSYLCKTNQVDVVITEDTDVLAYGCPHWISNLAHDGSCIYIGYDNMLKKMKFAREQFIDFCILCGTDYNETIKGLGPVTAYQLLITHVNIEKAVQGKDPVQIQGLQYPLLRTIFSNPCMDAIPSKENCIPYKVCICFNRLPEESMINVKYGVSFKKWLSSYTNQFILE